MRRLRITGCEAHEGQRFLGRVIAFLVQVFDRGELVPFPEKDLDGLLVRWQ